METFPRYWPFVTANSPVTPELLSQRPVTRSFDVFFCICAGTNGWANNQDAGDLRRHRAHCDAILMSEPTQNYLESASAKWPFCLGRNMLRHGRIYEELGIWLKSGKGKRRTAYLPLVVTAGFRSKRHLHIIFVLRVILNKRLNKQLNCRWFATQWRSRDVTVMGSEICMIIR